jgi:signal transduction histidine kinase
VIRRAVAEGGALFAEVDVERVLRRLRAKHAYPLGIALTGVADQQGRQRPVFDAPIRPGDVLRDVVAHRLGVVLLLLLAVALLYLLGRLLVWKTIFPFTLLVGKLDSVIKGDRSLIDARSYPAWLRPFVGNINRLIASVIETQEQERRTMASAAVQETASQVAHDIRSPLAALHSLAGALAQLPEDERRLLRGAVARIEDIAENLSGRARLGEAGQPPARLLLSSLLEPLLAEKRMQFRSREGLELGSGLGAESYGLFAEVQPAEFKRALSNLINNSVEALGARGRVRVSAAPDGPDHVAVTVEDDGAGVAADLLPRLGRRGETRGKAGGAGLGLYYARSRAEAWGGSLTIRSEPGRGCAVTLRLPRAPAPAWFVPRLRLSPGSDVVVLDDDPSIHDVWDARFAAARLEAHGVRARHFSTARELRRWAGQDARARARALFLVDHELAAEPETGLDLLRSLGLEERGILVTGRAEESAVLEACAALGVRLIPKSAVASVPIDVAGGA